MIRELIEVDGARAVAVVGYSLGGNVALKLAGEGGRAAPAALRAVCAVSPTLDLARCVAALERRRNALYEWNFVRNLKRRMRRKARAAPGRFDLARLGGVRTVREFDEAFTAPHHGFRDAADYYHRASSLRVIDRVAVPALILSARDDPFVPPGAVPRSRHRRQPPRPDGHHRPGRALRLPRGARAGLRRLLGGARGGGLRAPPLRSGRRTAARRPAASRSTRRRRVSHTGHVRHRFGARYGESENQRA